MGQPLADIIILSLNRANDTIAAIESALRQQDIDCAIWVLDQGSDPDNLARLEAFCRGKPVHLEKSPVNLGVAGGRNKQTALGKAPYIIALDNDAIFADETTVRRAVDYLSARPDLGAIAFQILNFTTGQNDEYSWGYPKAVRHLWNSEFDTIKFVGAGHAIKRAEFERAGGYDDRLFFCFEELDLCYRFLNLGLKIRYVPSVKVLHRVSPELRVSWTGTRFYYLVRNRLYIHLKYGGGLPGLAMLAGGYLAKGAYNGVLGQAVRALRDLPGLYGRFRRETPDRTLYRMTPWATAYIDAQDTQLRGSLWHRLKLELFARLPSQQVGVPDSAKPH